MAGTSDRFGGGDNGLAVWFRLLRIAGDICSDRDTVLAVSFDRLGRRDNVLSVWFLRDEIARYRGFGVGIHLVGPTEETASFPFGFLWIRSPELGDLLLEFIDRENIFVCNKSEKNKRDIKKLRGVKVKGSNKRDFRRIH